MQSRCVIFTIYVAGLPDKTTNSLKVEKKKIWWASVCSLTSSHHHRKRACTCVAQPTGLCKRLNSKTTAAKYYDHYYCSVYMWKRQSCWKYIYCVIEKWLEKMWQQNTCKLFGMQKNQGAYALEWTIGYQPQSASCTHRWQMIINTIISAG